MTTPRKKIKTPVLPAPSRPPNWVDKIADFISNAKVNNRIQDGFRETINRNSKCKIFRFKYTDIEDRQLVDRFLEKYYLFEEDLREALAKEVKLEYGLEKITEKVKEDIHIIFDFEDRIPSRLITNFNKVLDIGQYCEFECKILTPNIHKITLLKTVIYECPVCDGKTERNNNLYGMRDMGKPEQCSGTDEGKLCKNKWFREEDIFDKTPLDIGYFKVGDLDPKHFNELTCKIFRNLPYFLDIFDKMNVNETVRIKGILRTDDSYLFRRKTQKDDYTFKKYIEVIDITPIKTREIDEKVIKTISEKIEKNPTYLRMLIDAVKPFTFGIDIFFQNKLALLSVYISGGHFDERLHLRKTVNVIVISGGGVFKSSTQHNIERIVNDRDCIFFEGKNVTLAGLTGTTTRNKEIGTTEIKTGIMTHCSNGSLYFDEVQLITNDKSKVGLLDCFRGCEKGIVHIIQDALNYPAPAKASYCMTLNSSVDETGYYDHREPIWKNIGLAKENALSLIERFDLTCIIAKPDNTVLRLIADNKRRESKGTLIPYILDLLEINDYNLPENVKLPYEKLNYILRNWLYASKDLYRKQILPRKQSKKIESVYDQALENNNNNNDFAGEIAINVRVQNTCERLINIVSAFHLLEEANDNCFDFFKMRFAHMMTALKNRKVKLLQLDNSEDHKQIFIETAEELLRKTKVLYLSDHIVYMREYIKRVYHPEVKFDYIGDDPETIREIKDIEKKIDSIVKEGTSLGLNYPYVCLLGKCEEELKHKNIFKKKFKDRICLIKNTNQKSIDIWERKDNLILRKVLEVINIIYEENDENSIEIKSLITAMPSLVSEIPDDDEEKILEYILLLKDNGYLDNKILEDGEL